MRFRDGAIFIHNDDIHVYNLDLVVESGAR